MQMLQMSCIVGVCAALVTLSPCYSQGVPPAAWLNGSKLNLSFQNIVKMCSRGLLSEIETGSLSVFSVDLIQCCQLLASAQQQISTVSDQGFLLGSGELLCTNVLPAVANRFISRTLIDVYGNTSSSSAEGLAHQGAVLDEDMFDEDFDMGSDPAVAVSKQHLTDSVTQRANSWIPEMRTLLLLALSFARQHPEYSATSLEQILRSIEEVQT